MAGAFFNCLQTVIADACLGKIQPGKSGNAGEPGKIGVARPTGPQIDGGHLTFASRVTTPPASSTQLKGLGGAARAVAATSRRKTGERTAYYARPLRAGSVESRSKIIPQSR